MNDDDPPELASGHDPEERPVRGARRRRTMRIAMLVALFGMTFALVLPALNVAQSAATRVCAIYVSAYDAQAATVNVSFELTGSHGSGWICSAVDGNGQSTAVRNLGWFPTAPRVSPDGVYT